MARFIKNNKRNPLERTSSQGLVLGCPICAAKLDLLDTRDGDQAYWCHHCQCGWRAGNLPEAAHRSKDSAISEPQVEAVISVVETRVTGKARGAKTERDGAASSSREPRSEIKTLTTRGQRQLAALAPLTRLRRPLPAGEAKKLSLTAPQANAKPLVTEVIAPKRRVSPQVPITQPEPTVPPKRSASPRAAEVVVSPQKTVAPKKALNETQKKPLLETNSKASRRAAQTVAPISKPIKAKPQPLEVVTPRSSQASGQKKSKETVEIAASVSEPRRTRRAALEMPAPVKAVTPRAKRSTPESVISGKGSRKPLVPTPKAPTGKRQPLEVAAKPNVSAPRITAPKPSKKTLEIAAPTKALRAKLSRREQSALETIKGARQRIQTATPLPKAVIGKRQKLEVPAPKIGKAQAVSQKSQKKTLGIAAPIKPSRRKKPILEIAAASPQKTRQRKPAPSTEPTSKPRRSTRVAAPVKSAPEQRNTSARQAQASAPPAILEPSLKPRRAARAAAQLSPAPVKTSKSAPTKLEPSRAARVPKPPATVAPRPKPTRSSSPRPAPASPVQLGLFDALPMKTAPRRSAK